MSRTPEVIRNKKAEKVQGWFYAGGVLTGLLSWGAFSNGDGGMGLIMVLVAVGLIWIGTKIKTTYRKKCEVGWYR